jgi:hypothetical protein
MRNKSKIQEINMKFLRSIAGKRRRDRIINEIFREEAGTQNLLTELEKKQLQWFAHVKRMDRTRISRTSELKLKGKRCMG